MDGLTPRELKYLKLVRDQRFDPGPEMATLLTWALRGTGVFLLLFAVVVAFGDEPSRAPVAGLSGLMLWWFAWGFDAIHLSTSLIRKLDRRVQELQGAG